jgi:hypothetical protein
MGARLLVGSLVALLVLLTSGAAAGQRRDPKQRLGQRIERAFHPSHFFQLPVHRVQFHYFTEPLFPSRTRPGSEGKRYDLVGRAGDRVNLALFEDRGAVDAQRVRLRLALPALAGQRPSVTASGGFEAYWGHGFEVTPEVARRVPTFYEMYWDRLQHPNPVTVVRAGLVVDTQGGFADGSAALSAAALLIRIVAVAAR